MITKTADIRTGIANRHISMTISILRFLFTVPASNLYTVKMIITRNFTLSRYCLLEKAGYEIINRLRGKTA